MIIKYPTGAYNIFNSLSKADNITWYISSNDPPRNTDVVLKIPTAEEIRSLPTPVITRQVRRNSYGELIFTINKANSTSTMSSVKAYSEGDILDFSTDDRSSVSIPRSDDVQIRHDLNEIDFNSVGLDESDVKKFNSSVDTKQNELEVAFAATRSMISDIEISIKETQKKINESNKALNAVIIIGDKDLQTKISEKKSVYESEMTKLVSDHNTLVEQLKPIVDDMFKIGMVAK